MSDRHMGTDFSAMTHFIKTGSGINNMILKEVSSRFINLSPQEMSPSVQPIPVLVPAGCESQGHLLIGIKELNHTTKDEDRFCLERGSLTWLEAHKE